MKENPYQSPTTGSLPAERNWGRHFGWSITTSAVAFGLLLTISYVQPFGLFTDAPSSLPRRVTAGLMMLLQLTFFGGVLVSLVAGITWLTRTLRK